VRFRGIAFGVFVVPVVSVVSVVFVVPRLGVVSRPGIVPRLSGPEHLGRQPRVLTRHRCRERKRGDEREGTGERHHTKPGNALLRLVHKGPTWDANEKEGGDRAD
jgi:hypothetical protein